MNEPNSKPEKPKDQRRFSQEQYDMLMRCSEMKNVTEWNEWRKEHSKEDILLEGANIARARRVSPEQEVLSRAYLQGVNLSRAYLKDADLRNSDLQDANLYGAHMEGTRLEGAHLEAVCFIEANLKGANFLAAHLKGSDLMFADLEGAILNSADLDSAQLHWTDLRGACFRYTHLKNSRFGQAIVDGLTTLWECEVNRNTGFRGVSLDNIRIDPGTKQLLEYNIRRKNWEVWYDDENEPIRDGVFIFSNKKIRLKTNKILTWLVRKFWQISDYGISTKQIIWTFFKWAVGFAIVYYAWGCIDYYLLSNKDYPGIVSNLFFLEDSKQAVSGWLVPLRAVYFSIVTMTTLGLGDMYANAHSLFRGIFGHILLAFQVILGYVLLGALVTRFAVLFTAGGPAGKFADEKEKEDNKK